MITRTINKYNVTVKALAQIDDDTFKMSKVGEFEYITAGKPTETELRKAAKAAGIEIHKGYKVNAEVISAEVYGIDETVFMQYAVKLDK